ncbi:tyrosine-type recombinase/integrase [Ectobacillus antri]|jgi:integrase|uniref:Tyrosine-type recombinase/integrase n=1 Tax=Ectobacillus antri TaxID=2486280 RepID=A0ABT6H5Y1_9BACI|nr:tyrosine-type recombinase/integrase [Ectobacillus antri]MDG4656915.1 tyrosine-type recombinase/integrase [Ectobacillus antri]MDG5754188.1 tyrosine-type recombinase/integrase [Ectobacillus antri]
MDFDKILKHGKKGFYFRTDVGKDPVTGKRTQKSFGPYKNKAEAKKAFIEIKNHVNEGSYFEPSDQLFEGFITEWFETIYKTQVHVSTAESRKYMIEKRVIPYFKKRPLKGMTKQLMAKFIADQANDGCSAAYIKNLYSLLNQAFDTAVDWKLIKENPIKGIKKPSVKSGNKTDKTWGKEEINAFLLMASERGVTVPYILSINTGLRRGELLALTWKDLDWENGTIRIDKSVYRVKGEGLKIGPTKTENSNRTIPLADYVINVLRQHKAVQESIKDYYGEGFNPLDLVFPSENGNIMDPDNFSRQFRKIVEKLQVKKISLHGLRHTHATILMKAGVNAKVVADRLGHSRVQITLDYYTHTDEEVQKQTSEILAGFLHNE